MKSNYVMVWVKLCLKIGNDENLILCNFDGESWAVLLFNFIYITLRTVRTFKNPSF